VHCQVKDENLKSKIKHMFLRPCRNTRTYEQLCCVNSNAHQSQYLCSANGSRDANAVVLWYASRMNNFTHGY